MANEYEDILYGWEQSIDGDESQGSQPLLKEGDYDFEVISFERKSGTTQQNGRTVDCLIAEYKIKVKDGNDSRTITESLYLKSSVKWKIQQFFLSIGDRKHGEEFKPNWQGAVGKTGRCHVIVEKFIGKRDNKEHETNKIGKYLEPESDGDIGFDSNW